MTVEGVGVDIVRIERVRRILDGPGAEGFIDAVFTDREILTGRQYADAAVYYATRLAIKEAVFKCFHVGFADGDSFRDIEVHADTVGAPSVTISGRFHHLMAQRRANAPEISVSIEDEYVVAMAVLEAGSPS